MKFHDDLANNVEQMREDLIGKQFRNKNFIVLGTIVDVVFEVDSQFNCSYYWLVLDTGKRINTLHVKECL
jgi:hypothetical protein